MCKARGFSFFAMQATQQKEGHQDWLLVLWVWTYLSAKEAVALIGAALFCFPLNTLLSITHLLLYAQSVCYTATLIFRTCLPFCSGHTRKRWYFQCHVIVLSQGVLNHPPPPVQLYSPPRATVSLKWPITGSASLLSLLAMPNSLMSRRDGVEHAQEQAGYTLKHTLTHTHNYPAVSFISHSGPKV